MKQKIISDLPTSKTPAAQRTFLRQRSTRSYASLKTWFFNRSVITTRKWSLAKYLFFHKYSFSYLWTEIYAHIISLFLNFFKAGAKSRRGCCLAQSVQTRSINAWDNLCSFARLRMDLCNLTKNLLHLVSGVWPLSLSLFLSKLFIIKRENNT